jgi:hypothetical protein
MKRRKFILGTGAAAAGGASLLGSGAFTSVSAERSVAVDVAGDANALLRLGPCTNEDGNAHPNGAYVHGHTDGTISIDLSGGNQNDPPAGSGVNNDAVSTFHNVFEICNQGTQPVCVNFSVDVPDIPGPVPSRYEFEAGTDPAVVFYEGSDENATIGVESSDPNEGHPLNVGDCLCVGFNVRAFGEFENPDLFAESDLTINASAGVDCTQEKIDPGPIIEGFQVAQTQAELERCVQPVVGEMSVEDYYDWDNRDEYGNEGKYSARPELQPEPGESELFLYGHNGDLYLILIHGNPEDGTYKNTFEFSGLTGGEWVVKDDDPETYSSEDSYSSTEATWRWGSPRTDGGAYGPLSLEPGQELTITPPEGGISGIESWKFVDGFGDKYELSQDQPVTISVGCGDDEIIVPRE